MYNPYRSPASEGGNGSAPAKNAYAIAIRIVVGLGMDDRRILKRADIQVRGTQREVDIGKKVLEMIGKTNISAMEVDVLSEMIKREVANEAYRELFGIAIEYSYLRALKKDSSAKKE